MKIAVFAYNFPHKKSQDTITRLILDGFNIDCVIACNSIDLKQHPQTLRVKPRHTGLVDTYSICKRFDIPFYVMPHNSQDTLDIIKEHDIDLGIIAGARILKKEVIDAFKIGILNIHPGVLPYVRGLDTLKWTIYNNYPIGVTGHLINEKVDAGRIIEIKEVKLYRDDTLIDISLRLYETGIDMLRECILKLQTKNKNEFLPVDVSNGYNRLMQPDKELMIADLLNLRLSKSKP
jgi:phosphoribosylglycinamide formyltransferase-1